MRPLLFLALLAAGCDLGDSSERYTVAFVDLSGAEVARAEVSFDRPAVGERTEGTYRALSGQRVTSSEVVRATGLAGGEVEVSLDPGIADSGYAIVGPFSAGVSTGEWVQETSFGQQRTGTFRAMRQ